MFQCSWMARRSRWAGSCSEGAGRSCRAERALLLHGAFVDGLWASGRLHPAGVHAAHGLRERSESDVVPLPPEGTPVWVRADNAHCGGPFLACSRRRGWDCSASVTHPSCKDPVLEQLEGLWESAWRDIGLCEEAEPVRHKPDGWAEHPYEAPYVVVRKFPGGARGELSPSTPSSSSPGPTRRLPN